VYRPPYSDLSAQRNMVDTVSCLQTLTAVNYPSTITGDFNLPHMDWNLVTGPCDNLYGPFSKFLHDSDFTQFVSSPTRGANILDIVLSNDPYLVSDCWIESPLGFNSSLSKASDRCSVYFNLHCGLSTSAAVPVDFMYRDCANAAYVGLNNYLAWNIDWQFVMVNSYDVNLYWNSFVHAMNAAIALFVPLKHKKSILTSRRWHNPHFIRQLFRKRLAAWQAHHRFDTTKAY